MTAATNRRNRRAQARSRRRAGRKTTQVGASATTTWGYDSSDRLQYLRSGSLTRFTYSYDNNSNLKTVEDLIGSRSTYLYDAKNRLTQDASSGTNAHTYDYSYDSRDNRTYSGEEGQWQFAYDAANRLVTAVNAGEDPEPVRTFTYDDNGNMTRIEDSIVGTTTMAYDCENRLSVLQTASSLATYLYDGDGRKRVEIGGSGRTTLVWDGWDYLQSYAGSKPLDYHTVDGLILAQRMDEDYAEYLPDFLGTVAAYADESGSALAEARYKPYGLPLWSDGPVEDYAFGWVGQLGNLTAHTLLHLRHGTYSPATSCYLDPDPQNVPLRQSAQSHSSNPLSMVHGRISTELTPRFHFVNVQNLLPIACVASCVGALGCGAGVLYSCQDWHPGYKSYTDCVLAFLEDLPIHSQIGCIVTTAACFACAVKYAKPVLKKIFDGKCTKAQWDNWTRRIHIPCDEPNSCDPRNKGYPQPPHTIPEMCAFALPRIGNGLACLLLRIGRQIACYESDLNPETHLKLIRDQAIRTTQCLGLAVDWGCL